MNFHLEIQRLLRETESVAGPDWDNVPHAQQIAAWQSLKMRAALRMVLLFYTAPYWSHDQRLEWFNLQVDAGLTDCTYEASTRVLCDAVRSVLGEELRGIHS